MVLSFYRLYVPAGGHTASAEGADDMQKTNNLQEIFLTRARKQNIPVTMFLVNGFQLRGTITGFDCFVVILDSEGKQQVIYKHAISTLAPIRPLKSAAPAV